MNNEWMELSDIIDVSYPFSESTYSICSPQNSRRGFGETQQMGSKVYIEELSFTNSGAILSPCVHCAHTHK